MKYAVIDLGSNTFHILIVDVSEENKSSFHILHRASYFTSLSRGGGDTILPDIFDQAILVLKEMKTILDVFSVDHIKVIGTAVLRKAKNSPYFKLKAEETLCLPISIIDGLAEAKYIALGTTLHKNMCQGTHLVMDIGGGSTEFILLDNGHIKWMQSYPLGVGVLKEKFFKHDPILETEINVATQYFDRLMSDLKNEIKNIRIESVTGASGTFEALEKIYFGETGYGMFTQTMELQSFEKIYHDLITLTFEKRLIYPNMPEERALLIPIGLLLIRFIIELANPEKILITHFAMKEGILREMMDNSRI